MQEDGADFECLLVVAVAALDDLLAFIGAEQFSGGQPRAGEVGRQRVDPVGLPGGGDRVVVARPGERRLAVAVAVVVLISPSMLLSRIRAIRTSTCLRVL